MAKSSIYKLVLIAGFSIISYCYGENLGVVGTTYPIAEPDLIDVIKGRAQNLIDSGQWAKIQAKTVADAKNQILNPPALSNISDAKESYTHYYDPSFYLDRDLFDPQGRLIAKRGVYNPLTFKPFLSELIFINGNNPDQVKWAVDRFQSNGKKTKIILTSGKYIDLDKTYKIWFYYDQNGKYTSKFSINHVPAVVYQEGKKIRIDELKLGS